MLGIVELLFILLVGGGLAVMELRGLSRDKRAAKPVDKPGERRGPTL